MNEPFSTYVITALADAITGGAGGGGLESAPAVGIYRSGPKIERFFLDCGHDMRVGPKSRGLATLDALRAMGGDPDKGRENLTRVILKVCDPREYLSEPDKAKAVCEHMNRALEADGLEVTLLGGRAYLTARSSPGVIVEPFTTKVATLNFDTVQSELARALVSLDADPEDSITAACSLIEAVCRSILVELMVPLPSKKDIDGLVRAVQEPLGLAPGQSGLPSEIEQDIRQILGGLTTIAKGIGALRTHAGDAHGREKGFTRIDPRIARLALNSASTFALFLIATWEQKEKRALPRHEGNT